MRLQIVLNDFEVCGAWLLPIMVVGGGLGVNDVNGGGVVDILKR